MRELWPLATMNTKLYQIPNCVIKQSIFDICYLRLDIKYHWVHFRTRHHCILHMHFYSISALNTQRALATRESPKAGRQASGKLEMQSTFPLSLGPFRSVRLHFFVRFSICRTFFGDQRPFSPPPFTSHGEFYRMSDNFDGFVKLAEMLTRDN